MRYLFTLIALLLTLPAYTSETTKYNAKANTPIRTLEKLDITKAKVINLDTPIFPSSSDEVVNFLDTNQKAGVVYILLNSPGGSIMDGLAIIEKMQAIRPYTQTICVITGEGAFSMAAVISMYCNYTFMQKDAALMFHDASISMSGEVHQMKSRFAYLVSWLDGFHRDVAVQIGMPTAQYTEAIKSELWFTAQQASAQNLVNGVVNVLKHSAPPLSSTMRRSIFDFEQSEKEGSHICVEY